MKLFPLKPMTGFDKALNMLTMIDLNLKHINSIKTKLNTNSSNPRIVAKTHLSEYKIQQNSIKHKEDTWTKKH